MIKSRKIDMIVAIAVVFALMTSAALVVLGNIQARNGGFRTEPEYATKIFGTDIISLEIIVDEDDWREMLDNAVNEQFIMADVIVNGTKFKNVGIRPKGNSSLIQVASSDSDRYSFRLQFDEYISGQTCFGLESFVLNNMLGDNTYMKEYISYDLMREAGVDAPYFGFADIRVNGKDWGLYLAVELYNDSYEKRVFGDTSGMLYNVKSMDIGGNNGAGRPDWPGGNGGTAGPGRQDGDEEAGNPAGPGGNITVMPGMRRFPAMPGADSLPLMPGNEDIPVFPDRGDHAAMPEENNPQAFGQWQNNAFQRWPGMIPGAPGNAGMGRAFGGWGRRGSSGGSLEYTDDNIESYSAIFGNVVGKGTESDCQRVIKALKALSEGRDLETYFDVDKILRYLAAHTIVVNLDSYSSNMAQNYYIYERDGKITILPWDYNLAWGGFQGGSASSVINFPIDTPVSGVEMSARPLIDKLFENEGYLERYHSYLQQLIDNYFANGKFEEKIKALDALISDYVKNDATAFCTYEEYKAAVSAFITLGTLRAQSVQGQLDGTIPSTTEGQRKEPSKLVPAGNLDLSVLGSNMGRGRGGNMGFPGEMGRWQFGGMTQNERQRTQPDEQAGSTEKQTWRDGQQEQTEGQTARPGRQWEGVGDTDGTWPQLQQQQQSRQRQQWQRPQQQPPQERDDPFGRFGIAAPTGQQSYTENFYVPGTLLLALAAAILFARGIKRSY